MEYISSKRTRWMAARTPHPPKLCSLNDLVVQVLRVNPSDGCFSLALLSPQHGNNGQIKLSQFADGPSGSSLRAPEGPETPVREAYIYRRQ